MPYALDVAGGESAGNPARESKKREPDVEEEAVVVHEPPDEGVKWEAQSAEEVGKEYDPLMGPGGGDELPLVGQPVRDIAGKVSGAAQFCDVLLRNGGGQPFLESA